MGLLNQGIVMIFVAGIVAVYVGVAFVAFAHDRIVERKNAFKVIRPIAVVASAGLYPLLSIRQLKSHAAARGVFKYSRLNKNQLIAALSINV